MAHWLTADLHLGHANISSFCGRPYDNVDEMNTDLIDRWNQRVSPDDEVTVVGDVCMGRLGDSLALIELLNGTKRLIPGNHDRVFDCKGTKYANTVQRYLDAGFDVVLDEQCIWPGGYLLCHFPYQGESRDGIEDRYQEHRPVDFGCKLIHGHVHEKWRKRGRMVNVGVDAWGGYPVAVEDVVALFESDEEHVPPLPW